MENKYYTPEIGDLHIGYECEKRLSGEFSEHVDIFLKEDATTEDYDKAWDKYYNTDAKNYVKHVLTFEDFKLLNVLTIRGYIRTPILTKEQIEAEGWKFIKNMSPHYVVNKFTKRFWHEGIEYTLIKHSLGISITPEERKDISLSPSYEGTCPSINEFRTICKLLRLK